MTETIVVDIRRMEIEVVRTVFGEQTTEEDLCEVVVVNADVTPMATAANTMLNMRILPRCSMSRSVPWEHDGTIRT